MNKIKVHCLLFFSIIIFMFPVKVFASENGGKAGNNAGIEFYNDNSSLSSSSSSLSSKEEVVSSSNPAENSNGVLEKFPQTDEFKSKFIWFLGLVILVLTFFLQKKRIINSDKH